jgi:hypothetical protein
MSSSRVAVVVLVVVAIAFVAITVGGQGAGGGTPDWMTSLGSTFVKPATVRLSELQAPDCFDGTSAFTLAPGRPCVVAVAAADRAPVRDLTLALAAGAKVQVRVQPRSGDVAPIAFALEAGRKPPKIQVFKDGADVSLTCETPGPAMLCRLERR